jgi:hypothetical protein
LPITSGREKWRQLLLEHKEEKIIGSALKGSDIKKAVLIMH